MLNNHGNILNLLVRIKSRNLRNHSRVVTAIFILLLVCLPLACSGANTSSPLLWWQLQNPQWYINGYTGGQQDSKQVHNDAALFEKRMGEPKEYRLRYALFDTASELNAPLTKTIKQYLIKDPTGRVEQYPLLPRTEDEQGAANWQARMPMAEQQPGIYLLASHGRGPDRDMDGDGTPEHCFFSAFALTRHLGGDNSEKGAKDHFIDDPELPLVIGPLRAGRYSSYLQVAHRPYTMVVYYHGAPLAGARVTVMTERGWRTQLTTDKQGQVTVAPLESRGKDHNWENYLYVVEHLDSRRSEYHTASIAMLVDPPWPEWTSKTAVFTLWACGGSVLLIVLLLLQRERIRRQKSSALTILGGR